MARGQGEAGHAGEKAVKRLVYILPAAIFAVLGVLTLLNVGKLF